MNLPAYGTETLPDIANYQVDAEKSLRLYFSQDNPNFAAIFTGKRMSDVREMLVEILGETARRSGLVLLARIEAAFRVDYQIRSKRKDADTLSIELRRLWKRKGRRARLEEEIWEVWRNAVDPPTRQLISHLRGVFKYRHWIAHGRYWNVGYQYNFEDLYILATAVLSSFPLYE